MSDDDFLSRWSHHKRLAESSPESLSQSPVPDPPVQEDEGSAVNSEAGKPVEAPDLSALPPLDAITAATNVTAFLRKGVPLALTREALRRVWLADPAIRDFIGLAENAWDFNDPNAMPGFGPLDYTPEQVRDLVARIVSERKPVAGDDANSATPQLQQNVVSPADPPPESSPDRETAADAPETTIDQIKSDGGVTGTGTTTPRSLIVGEQAHCSVVRRTHGSALPQ